MRSRQQKVRDVIRRLLPRGSDGSGRWDKVPMWPPDLFAVAATLVDRSGCYANTRYLCGFGDCTHDEAYWNEIEQLAAELSAGRSGRLQRVWKILLERNWLVQNQEEKSVRWWDAAMKLLAVADEACSGVGFVPDDAHELSARVFDAYRAWSETGENTHLPHIPNSLCLFVPPDELCVQPKTLTPQVGCTLRSLSHNLALLPAIGEVETFWNIAVSPHDNSEEPLNVLLVPYPYRIRGGSFAPSDAPEPAGSRAGMFDVRQTWITDTMSAAAVGTFIQELIGIAQREAPRVHAVVFPEAALPRDMAEDVAEILGKEADIELFVTGAASAVEGRMKNHTFSAIYKKRELLATWEQSKHHRWKLDEHQIRRYNLGQALGLKRSWWENIDVAKRRCQFYVFRHGASLAVLVCEDLARIDPVQTVVRSVGPNLVIALLMDGVQMERRWPGRYATVLADDPGSAVLTLTSLALIRRSQMPSERGPRSIALWKDSWAPSTTELELPDGAHALLLTISPKKVQTFTADGRSDKETTMSLTLTSVIAVRHGNPPAWIDDI